MMAADTGTSRQLTREEVESYRRDGAVLLKGVIERQWLDLLGEVAEEMKLRATDNSDYYGEGQESQRSTVVKDEVWREHPAMRRFLEESPAAAMAAQAMGSSHARIYEDLLIYKQTAAGATPWHQDEPQWPVTGRQLTSLWISLEATTPDTGSLRFMSGTQEGPLYVPYVPDSQAENLKKDMTFFTGGPLPDVEAAPDRFRQLTFATEPGDAILFHPRAIHAAMGSHADRARRTFSIRFLGEDVRWQPKASVYYDWLRDIDLPTGAPVEHERFEKFWPLAAEIA